MSDKTTERQGYGDEQGPEDLQPPEEGYESPRVDDIPLDQPATTYPGVAQVIVDGSPSVGDSDN
jgi:hypothetical protein